MNEPVKLGEVLDDQGTEISVYREVDGSVALWAPDIGWHERFEPRQRDELIRLLDCAAMPGQDEAHAAVPHIVTNQDSHLRHGCPTCLTAEAHAAQAGDGGG